MIKKFTLILSFTLLINTTLLTGCGKNNNALKASDLIGCWVSTEGYNSEKQIVDTVIEFIDESNMAVYSYFDKGKKVYTYKVEESNDKSITILIDDEVNKPTKLEFLDENNFKFTASSDNETINMTRINQSEAEKFIDVLESYAEY